MPTIKKHCHRPWQPKREPQQGRQHSNTKFYQSTQWRKLRALKLSQQPLCEECLTHGTHTPASVADHITPINRGGVALDIENLQSLCSTCHNKKSAKERHLQ